MSSCHLTLSVQLQELRDQFARDKEIRADRKANGGNLTNNEKNQINRQQNTLSRDIYRDKHNGATQQ